MALPTKGETTKMRPQGPDESALTHGSNPQRAAWEDGHGLNESYKIPTPHPQGRPNYSYMHPLVNPNKANAPKMAPTTDPGHGEKELTTKTPAGMSGKSVFTPRLGKNKS
jgi:hypothetical protein